MPGKTGLFFFGARTTGCRPAFSHGKDGDPGEYISQISADPGGIRTANGSLVPSYYSTLSVNETYTISEPEALQEYLTNVVFQTVVNSGLYLYVAENGCYCLNDRKYLYFDHAGHPHLRRYAREHMDKCWLVFRAEYTNVFRRFINGALQKGSIVGHGRRTIRYVNEKGGSPATEAGLQAPACKKM